MIIKATTGDVEFTILKTIGDAAARIELIRPESPDDINQHGINTRVVSI
jgi:hypothetical protein